MCSYLRVINSQFNVNDPGLGLISLFSSGSVAKIKVVKDIGIFFFFFFFFFLYFELILKFNVGLKTLLRECLSEPEFYGDLVHFKKLLGRNDILSVPKNQYTL